MRATEKKQRTFHRRGLLRALAVSLFAVSCSSGLEGDGAKGTSVAATPATSSNLRMTFDPGMPLTEGITDYDLSGGVLPGGAGPVPGASSHDPGRPVSFLVFVTEAEADDGDGQGNALDRTVPAPADAPGTRDVFLAAVASDLIDTRAFVYSLAGKMQHPRCITCHMMNVEPTTAGPAGPSTAFMTGPPHIGGAPPLNRTTDDDCADCHFDDWRAPPASFDLRRNTAAQLAARAAAALNGPAGPEAHFRTDPRVLWALGSAQLPFGNVADDDHDGVAEPEDSDGVARMVPGGIDGFLESLDAWEESGQKFDSKEAVVDVVLMSRAFGVNSAGDDESYSPSAVYVPNAAFVAGVSDPDVVPVGFVHVAFASDATDLVGGGTNGATDVFRSTAAVFHRTDGTVDLEYQDLAQALVSEGPLGELTGDSTEPDIGGTDGELVAFVTTARDVLATANAGPGPDVYVRDLTGGSTLVSHAFGSTTMGGNGASRHPDMTVDGAAVTFESDASDLIAPGADTNGSCDVFLGFAPLFDLERASVADDGSEGLGGDSRHPSIYAFPGGTDARVAFESTKTNLVTDTSWLADSNVYLRDTRRGGSTLQLNRITGPGATKPARHLTPSDATHAMISPDGNAVLFETADASLDFVRPDDHNHASDVMLADLLQLDSQGFVLPYALSVGPDGGRGNGDSFEPRFGTFDSPAEAFPLGVALFATEATNLGNADVAADADVDGRPDYPNLMAMFLREGATVVSAFDAKPAKQGMGRPVEFVNRSSGKPTQFLWDFGDTETSTAANPTHTYATPGMYSVSLDVSGDLGSDMRTLTDFVRVLGPVVAEFETTKDASLAPPQGAQTNVPNTVNVKGAIETGVSSLGFLFDSAESDECPDEFDWQLVEVDAVGTPLGAPVSVSTDPTADIDLDTRGFYEMTLDATGPGGSGQASQTIEVWEKVTAAFTPTTATSGSAPLTVSFQDDSTGDIDAYDWSFGSTEASPTFQFAEGVHNVSLRVTGLGLDEDTTATIPVTAFGALTASFTPSLFEQVRNTTGTVTFTNQTMGTMGVKLFYRWDFGNGTVLTSDSDNPLSPAQRQQSYTVSTENVTTYTPRLTASVTDPAPANCPPMSATQCSEAMGTIRFFPTLQVGASVSIPNVNDPDRVQLTGSVVGDGVGTSPSYQWFRNSANGATPTILISTALSQQVNFPAPGNYLVKLRVTTNGANGGSQVVESTNRPISVYSTFTEVYSTLSASCIGCHSGTPSCAGNGEFVMGATKATAYASLVNVRAECGSGCTQTVNMDRVEPGNPSLSFLYRKVAFSTPGCGVRMPQGGPFLSSTVIKRFEFWILGGALNN